MSVFTHVSSYVRRSLFFFGSRKSNAERSAMPPLLTVLLVAGSVGLLAGCDIGGGSDSDAIAVAGVWELGTDWDGDGNDDSVERWTITSSSVHYESSSDGSTYDTTYRANVVEFVNGSFNAGDTALTGGGADAVNHGFAIVQYTEVDGAGTGEVNKYNIFRWAQNSGDTGARDFAQGYKNVGGDWPDNVNGVFDTAAAAETGATNGEGYFAFASSGAERVQP